MFPDGNKEVTAVTKRPESAGTHFKNSIISLVDNLATKVRCLVIAVVTGDPQQMYVMMLRCHCRRRIM